jgi:hypothetical protein
MLTETAIARGLLPADFEAQKPKATTTRSLTFDEVVEAMETSLDATLVSQMPAEGQNLVLAKRLLDGKLPYKVSPTVIDSNKAAVEELTKILSDDVKALVTPLLVDATGDNKPEVRGVPLDAEKFLTDVIFVTNHPGTVEEEISAYYEDARRNHAQGLKQMAGPRVRVMR